MILLALLGLYALVGFLVWTNLRLADLMVAVIISNPNEMTALRTRLRSKYKPLQHA